MVLLRLMLMVLLGLIAIFEVSAIRVYHVGGQGVRMGSIVIVSIVGC